MTQGALQVRTIARCIAILVPLCSPYTASADTTMPSGATAGRYPAHAYVRHHDHHTHYIGSNGHHDVYVHYPYTYTNLYNPYTNVYYPSYGIINPVATVAAAVVDSIAALGAIATYPLVCFPYYGSCPVYYPYSQSY
jgi:hypothetical protein